MKKLKPKISVELGAYLGYSAILIAKNLPANAVLYSIELDPVLAALSTKIIEWAGLSSKVVVLIGTAKQKIPILKSKFKVSAIDLLFIDHDKKHYVSDLKFIDEE